MQHKRWLYAQVIIAPGNNFSGLACFVKEGPHYNYCALDFKTHARKLLEKEELEKYRAQKDSDGCSLQ